MASSAPRLSRFFIRRPPTAPTAPVAPIAPKSAGPGYYTRLRELYNEQNISKFVQSFKKLSNTPRFRRSHMIYATAINRLVAAKEFDSIKQVLEHQKKYPEIRTEGFAVRLITLYGKAGMIDNAQQLFDEMPNLKCRRSVVSFNALLHAYLVAKQFEVAEKLFKELPPSLSISPVAHSYNVLMNGYYLDGRLSDGDRVWVRMEENGFAPDIVSYNSKIRALVNEGKISEAAGLLQEIRSRELKPNAHTYDLLIKAYCSEGNSDEAKRMYDCLLKDDCIPRRETFEALIPCIYDKGDLDFALKLCEESLGSYCFTDASILQTVVNALVKESRIKEAEKLVKLERSALKKAMKFVNHETARKYGCPKLQMPSEDE